MGLWSLVLFRRCSYQKDQTLVLLSYSTYAQTDKQNDDSIIEGQLNKSI